MYQTVGQKAFAALRDKPSAIAKAIGASRASVSQWRNGACKPNDEMRARIARAYSSVPVGAWDVPLPDTDPEADAESSPKAAPPPPAAPQLPTDAEIAAMGLDGIDRTIAELERYAPVLPAKEAWRVTEASGRLRLRREEIARKQYDARMAYLHGPEFRADVESFAKLAGADVYQRVRQATEGAFDVTLPELGAEVPDLTLEALRAGLGLVRDLRGAGEMNLAMVEAIRLRIPERATALALLLHETPAEADGILELLDADDRIRVQRALDLRFAVSDVQALDPGVRGTVAELLELLGHAELAEEVQA